MHWAIGAIVLEDFVSSFHFILLTWNIFCIMHVLLSIFSIYQRRKSLFARNPTDFQKEKIILKLYYIYI